MKTIDKDTGFFDVPKKVCFIYGEFKRPYET